MRLPWWEMPVREKTDRQRSEKGAFIPHSERWERKRRRSLLEKLREIEKEEEIEQLKEAE